MSLSLQVVWLQKWAMFPKCRIKTVRHVACVSAYFVLLLWQLAVLRCSDLLWRDLEV
jgi:hypothetical protein